MTRVAAGEAVTTLPARVARAAGRVGERAAPALMRAWPWMLATWFALLCWPIAQAIASHPTALFGEPALDVAVTQAWVAGGDPWAVSVNGIHFGGPPTTLVPYLPFTLLGPEPSRWVIGPLCLAASVLAIRQLRLPLYWLLWPPLFYAWIHASIDSLMPLLLIAGLGPIAAYIKIYVGVPLLVKPRHLLVLAGLIVLTVPFLPWAPFVSRFGEINAVYRSQVMSGGLSAWGNPLAMIAVGLAALRTWPDSRWLLVPALWPWAQFHYGAMALPFVGSNPLLAAGMAVPLPGFAPATLIGWGLWRVAHR